METDLQQLSLAIESGDHEIFQVNRGLLSPLYLPDPYVLLNLPKGNNQWQVFDFTLGANKTTNLTVQFGRRAWILAFMGSFNQDAGYKAILYDAAHKQGLSTTRELVFNLVGSASNPAWMPTPVELEPNTPLFIRVTNLAQAQGAGQLVVYAFQEAIDA